MGIRICIPHKSHVVVVVDDDDDNGAGILSECSCKKCRCNLSPALISPNVA